jgi:hypothetical protein
VLPLFAGIHRAGAGLGPAVTFLHAGQAIKVLALVVTARALGAGLGLARAIGALLVRWFGVPLRRVALAAAPVAVLAVAAPDHPVAAHAAGVAAVATLAALGGDELRAWLDASWDLAKQVLPLLAIGVAVSGLLLGRPGHEGLVRSAWIAAEVGGNSPGANLAASVVGALMDFATLTEVPILEGLLGSGMGRGPALALLLAGPAVSLPDLLVVRSVAGTRQAVVHAVLVVALATACGLLFGSLFPE